jgi:hypothetical protein
MRSKKSPLKSRITLCALANATVLQLGLLACSAQTTEYSATGSETNVTLNPGNFIVTAYGADGGPAFNYPMSPVVFAWGGLGAEMSAEFSFSAPTTLTLLVGDSGDAWLGFFANIGSSGGGGAVSPDAGAMVGGNGSVSTADGYGGGIGSGAGGTGGSGRAMSNQARSKLNPG